MTLTFIEEYNLRLNTVLDCNMYNQITVGKRSTAKNCTEYSQDICCVPMSSKDLKTVLATIILVVSITYTVVGGSKTKAMTMVHICGGRAVLYDCC